MSNKFARFGRKWLVAAAATSALVLGGGIAAAPAGYAAEEHDGEHGGHEGGDACTFFLEHMWANEDGIPLLGSFAHVNEYHTDPEYENLVLSLASGAIGNSEMPVVDIYGGPLGWIPIFNPSHVKGHGTDYVTLLTSCGGIGIPLDSNDLTTLNVPSVEDLADTSDLIMPGLPSPEMLTSPDYLWQTTDASAILDRVTPEALTNMEEYTGFAGDHLDTWRLLWETALEDVSSGNPTGILEVLQITDNIKTIESVFGIVGGEDGGLVGGLPGGELPELPGVELPELPGDELPDGGEGGGGLLGGLPIIGGGDGGGLLDGLPVGGGEDGGLIETLPIIGGDGTGGLLDGLPGAGEDGGGLIDGLPVGGDDAGGLLGLLPVLPSPGTPTTPPAEGTTEFSALLSGAAGTDGMGQCKGTLNGDTFTVSCLYAGLASDATGAELHSGDASFELAATGGTSGGAAGSFKLTSEQVAALNNGDFTVDVHTSGSSTAEISGTVNPCSCG
ncbi:CHRD domain-containing protein [Zhihengliuella halotolerans]|uniref:CHRD domain-containing protein n=1 Tax=Zhihengliuella halotolerans TaxID=370736 RepID=A0A4Q8AG89_9MICC|nr:CHRD domain-containing protein [Zhihengliuella halotolerans]RZU62659.1 CHRD domain-containing protein [Zhihengliuella halotolerans]